MKMRHSVTLGGVCVGIMLGVYAWIEANRTRDAVQIFTDASVCYERGLALSGYVADIEELAMFEQGHALLRLKAWQTYRRMSAWERQFLDPHLVEVVKLPGETDTSPFSLEYERRTLERYFQLEQLLRQRQQADRTGDAIIASSGLFFILG